MNASDLIGLIISLVVCAYLLYSLLRGEKF